MCSYINKNDKNIVVRDRNNSENLLKYEILSEPIITKKNIKDDTECIECNQHNNDIKKFNDLKNTNKFCSCNSIKFYNPPHVFYNPAQKFNRDMTITIIKHYITELIMNKTEYKEKIKKNEINILECMAATGLRSLRFYRELENYLHNLKQNLNNRDKKTEDFFINITANDLSPTAVDIIQNNCQLNNIPFNTSDNNTSGSINFKIKNFNCLSLLLRNKSYFDIIDIDPFGTSRLFLPLSIYAATDGGMICATFTDAKVLCNDVNTCKKRYNSLLIKDGNGGKGGFWCNKELALRIIYSYIEDVCDDMYNKITESMKDAEILKYTEDKNILEDIRNTVFTIKPVISISVDYYFRVFFTVHKTEKTNLIEQKIKLDTIEDTNNIKDMQTLSNKSILAICTQCKNFQNIKINNLDIQNLDIEGLKLTNISKLADILAYINNIKNITDKLKIFTKIFNKNAYDKKIKDLLEINTKCLIYKYNTKILDKQYKGINNNLNINDNLPCKYKFYGPIYNKDIYDHNFLYNFSQNTLFNGNRNHYDSRVQLYLNYINTNFSLVLNNTNTSEDSFNLILYFSICDISKTFNIECIPLKVLVTILLKNNYKVGLPVYKSNSIISDIKYKDLVKILVEYDQDFKKYRNIQNNLECNIEYRNYFKGKYFISIDAKRLINKYKVKGVAINSKMGPGKLPHK